MTNEPNTDYAGIIMSIWTNQASSWSIKNQSREIIWTIAVSAGNITHNPDEINTTFEKVEHLLISGKKYCNTKATWRTGLGLTSLNGWTPAIPNNKTLGPEKKTLLATLFYKTITQIEENNLLSPNLNCKY